MKITEICIRRPVLAWMLMAETVVFGPPNHCHCAETVLFVCLEP